MKIGIVTFHASYNCGSILQCEALVQILKSRHQDVQVINYSNKGQQNLYSVFLPNTSIKNVIKNLLCVRDISVIKSHFKQYASYITNTLPLSGKLIQDHDELLQLPPYDALIAGGDQVWNVNIDDFDTAYFLDFNNSAYKFSFSPSLGAQNINESSHKNEYRSLLMKFDDISCREVNGKNWLEELTDRSVSLVADPTLLLTREEWTGLIQNQMDLPEKFIFYYAFAYSPANNEAVERLAAQYDIPVVVIDAKQWFIRNLRKYKHFRLSDKTGPDAFLNLMKLSTFVLTTSFHGTVFSLNFGKQFLYIETKNHNKNDDRTSFILEQMGLKDRYLEPDLITAEALEKKISRQKVTDELAILRNHAENFLDKNLEAALKRESNGFD